MSTFTEELITFQRVGLVPDYIERFNRYVRVAHRLMSNNVLRHRLSTPLKPWLFMFNVQSDDWGIEAMRARVSIRGIQMDTDGRHHAMGSFTVEQWGPHGAPEWARFNEYPCDLIEVPDCTSDGTVHGWMWVLQLKVFDHYLAQTAAAENCGIINTRHILF